MKTHNSERQTVMKRKREEAEEESRKAKTNIEDLAIARVRRDKTKKSPKKTNILKHLKPRPSQKEATPNATESGPELQPKPASNRPHGEDGGRQDGDVTGTQQDADDAQAEIGAVAADLRVPIEPRAKAFLAILISNAASSRAVRRAKLQYNQWASYKKDLFTKRDGIRDLSMQIAELEKHGESAEDLRKLRGDLRRRVEAADMNIARAGPAKLDIVAFQVKRNSRMYDFRDVPRETLELTCLPQKFWDAFDNCQEANAASLNLGLELQNLELEQQEKYKRVDRYGENAVQAGSESIIAGQSTSSLQPTVRDTAETLQQHLRDLTKLSKRKQDLSDSLGEARDHQARLESTLNDIVHEALLECGLLHADLHTEQQANPTDEQRTGPQDKQQAHPTGEQGAVPQEEQRPEPQDVPRPPRDAGNVDDQPQAVTDKEQMESQGGLQENPPAGQSIGDRVGDANNGGEPGERDDRARPTEAALEALAAREAKARKKLDLYDDRLQIARHCVPSDALSLDLDQQGAARVIRLRQYTRELIDAEKEHKHALHEAQNAGLLINTLSQCSNFQNQPNDGYSPATLEGYGFPMAPPKIEDLRNWMDQITGDGNDQSVTAPNPILDADMDWDMLPEPGFGECDDDTAEGYKLLRLDEERKLQETLRRRSGQFKGAENYSRKSSETIQLEVWADLSRPVQPSVNGSSMHSSHEPAEELANQHSDIPSQKDVGDEGHTQGSKSNPFSLYDPDAPMVDYAVEGYDGINMDGNE